MNKKLGVFLGRMHPLHLGHISLINKMMKTYETSLIVIGSSEKSFEERNPLTVELRRKIIEFQFKEEIKNNKLYVMELDDLTNENDNSKKWGKYFENKIIDYIENNIVIDKFERNTYKQKEVLYDNGGWRESTTLVNVNDYTKPTGTEMIINYFEVDNNLVLHYSDSMGIISQWFNQDDTNFEFYIHNRKAIQKGISATEIRKKIMYLELTSFGYGTSTVENFKKASDDELKKK